MAPGPTRAPDGGDDVARELRLERQVAAGGGLLDRVADGVLDHRIEQVGGQHAAVAGVLVGDRAAERGAHVLGQRDRIALVRRPLGQRAQDVAQVAQRDPLLDQAAQRRR